MDKTSRSVNVTERRCDCLAAPTKVVDTALNASDLVRNVDDEYECLESNCLENGRQNLLASLVGAKVPQAQLWISLGLASDLLVLEALGWFHLLQLFFAVPVRHDM